MRVSSGSWRLVFGCAVIAVVAALNGCGGKSPEPVVAASGPKTAVSRAESGTGRAAREGLVSLVQSSFGTETSGSSEALSDSRAGFADLPETTTLVITGTVKRADRTPFPGVEVSQNISRFADGLPQLQKISSTVSDAEGRYRFALGEQPEGNSVHLRAEFKGFAPGEATVYTRQSAPVADGYPTLEQDLVLHPAAKIGGKVVGRDDKPLAGAKVIARSVPSEGTPGRQQSETTTSTADGSFSFDTLLPGNVELAAVLEGYVPATETVTAPAEDFTIRLTDKGARIDGYVTNYVTRQNVAGATVTLMHMKEGSRSGPLLPAFSAITDAVGAFEFEILPPGRYMADARAGKLKLFPTEGHVVSFGLEEGETSSGLTLHVYPGHTITGMVRNEANGEPLPGVRVATSGRGSENEGSFTGADGRYRLEGVQGYAGRGVTLSAIKKGYAVARGTRREQLSVPLKRDQLEAEKDIEMQSTLTISGTVKTENGDPVQGATIDKLDTHGGTDQEKSVTDEAGRYSIEVEPYTRARVEARAKGYPPSWSELLELDDRDVTADIVLKQGGTMSGVVVDPDGAPAEGAVVRPYTLVQTDTSSYRHVDLGEKKTGSDGSFFYENVPPGEINVSAVKPDYARSIQEKVTLASGQLRSNLKLALRTPHFVAGRVTDQTSAPVTGAIVWLQSRSIENNFHESKRTDKDGRYRFENVPEGVYTVRVSHQDDHESRDSVTVDRDDVDFVLGEEKGDGIIIATLLDTRTQRPINSFEIENTNRGLKIEKNSAGPGTFVVVGAKRNHMYTITLKAEGYIPQRATLPFLGEGESVEQTYYMGTGGTIVGRAVEAGKRTPLPGVRVILKGTGLYHQIRDRAPVATTVTDDHGRFVLEKTEAGKNMLILRPEKPFIEQVLNPVVEHGETADLGDIEFSGGGILRGRVVRMPGEVPVKGVRVAVNPATWDSAIRGGEAETDEEGKFEIAGLASVNFNVSLSSHNMSQQVHITEHSPAEMTFRLGNATLKGLVLLRGEPVTGANVSITPEGTLGHSTETDSHGRFEATDLMPGKADVHCSVWQNNQSNSGRAIVELTEGETVEGTFKLDSGMLAGRVIDGEGRPVKDATVRAETSARPAELQTVTTDAEGKWAMANRTAGEYSVVAHKNGFKPSEPANATVPEDGNSPEVILQLGPPQEGGKLISTVLKLSDGQPLQRAWVKLTKANGTEHPHFATRGSDGVMTVEAIPPGVYDVEVSAWGYSVANHPGTRIGAEEPVQFEDVLYECGSFDWKLVTKGGQPLPNVPVRLAPNAPGSIEPVRDGKTNEQGIYSTPGLSPGRYTAVASPPGKSPIELQVTIIAREGTEPTTVVE